MDKREAAIVSAYTGYLLGDFSEMHKYIEEVMGRPVYTHEMAMPGFMENLRELCRADFVALSPPTQSEGE